MRPRPVAFIPLLTLVATAVLLAGCASGPGGPGGLSGGHRCEGGTLHAQWVHPGLHEGLLRAPRVEGVEVEERAPRGLPLRNATLQARWGALGLVEVAYRPDAGQGMREAALHVDAEPEGSIRLAASVLAGEGPDEAVALAQALLDRMGVAEAEKENHLRRLRDAFQPSPPGVDNAVVSTPFTATLDVADLPGRLFTDGEPSVTTHSTRRTLSQGPWRLALESAALEVASLEEGHGVSLRVTADDHVLAFVHLAAGEPQERGMARVNATLARMGLGPTAGDGYDGAVAVC